MLLISTRWQQINMKAEPERLGAVCHSSIVASMSGLCTTKKAHVIRPVSKLELEYIWRPLVVFPNVKNMCHSSETVGKQCYMEWLLTIYCKNNDVTGAFEASWEVNPRRNGPVQQRSHIHSSLCCATQGQNSWAVQLRHKVSFYQSISLTNKIWN